MAVSDDIGSKGEVICYDLLTEFCGRARPFFDPHFLGEKFETFDYIVELIEPPGNPAYFFVQVKTTLEGYRVNAGGTRRLKVSVKPKDLLRMKNYPAPTYVIGIDAASKVGYIVSTNGDCPTTLSTMPINHQLTCANLALLQQEVIAYWASRNTPLTASRFGV